MATIIPVILSGGSGTRLWPLSRALAPKQFIQDLTGEGQSPLSTALTRLESGRGIGAPIVVCNNSHRFLVRDECELSHVEPAAIILEPVARNTAPAVAVAALHASQTDPEAILVVMPSDHAIAEEGAFAAAVGSAADVAATGKIVLFGIVPTEPHTGYGYIRKGGELDGAGSKAFTVASFTEKPNAERAAEYLASGEHFWNSGIFVFKADVLLAEMARYAPKVLSAARAALANATRDLGFIRLEACAFSSAPSISLDYAIMEQTTAAAVFPLDVGWSDLGSWSALWDVAEKDASGNAVQGDAILEDTTGCYVRSKDTLVTTVGVKDLVIVETRDTLLVADKNRAQDVTKIVARLKTANRKEHEQHVRNLRPWGFFETLNIGSRFQVKLLHVKPGGMLSMQMHHHRSEHWVVVQGTARVTVEDKVQLVRENESVYITATQWHRLENPGKVPLELIEVQIGTYLGEDDIIRSDDVYQRAPDETR